MKNKNGARDSLVSDLIFSSLSETVAKGNAFLTEGDEIFTNVFRLA